MFWNFLQINMMKITSVNCVIDLQVYHSDFFTERINRLVKVLIIGHNKNLITAYLCEIICFLRKYFFDAAMKIGLIGKVEDFQGVGRFR